AARRGRRDEEGAAPDAGGRSVLTGRLRSAQQPRSARTVLQDRHKVRTWVHHCQCPCVGFSATAVVRQQGKAREGNQRVTVNMTKGQAISLQKNDGGSLTAVRMGLGWQAAPRRGLFGSRTREIDLDASAVL